MKLDNSTTALKVIPRYIKLNPDFKEHYAYYLKDRGMVNLCVKVMLQILDDDGYHSKCGNSQKDFELEILDLVIDFPEKITCVNGQERIRACIEKYPSDQGKLWVKLSDYFVRIGQFEFARNAFESALEAIDNVKDFGVIFNAYTKFEDEMIAALGNQDIQSFAEVKPNDNVEYEIEERLKKL